MLCTMSLDAKSEPTNYHGERLKTGFVLRGVESFPIKGQSREELVIAKMVHRQLCQGEPISIDTPSKTATHIRIDLSIVL